ncbi:MAG: hypothetical protein ACPHT8_12565, partial [Limisphaerales bacterium]
PSSTARERATGWWISIMGFGIATLLLLTLHAWTTHMTTQLRGYGAESIKSSAEELLKHLHREEGSLHQMIVRSI